MIYNLFFLVRHGITNGNVDGCYRGWSNGDEAQLNAAGRDVVREAGIFLKGTGVDFPFIISDDLGRCIETREILADILGIKEHHADKRLRPLNVGDFTGKPKAEHPLTEYLNDKSMVIPGGESVAQFEKRESSFFDNVLETIEKIHKPILIVGHGSTVSYLHNAVQRNEPKVGYEGLVNPGGVLVFNKAGVTPLTQKRDGAASPLKDGTVLSGFVTAAENVPPRECWNCRYAVKEVNGLLGCAHPIVRIDPQLQNRKQADDTIAVCDRDCCDNFRNKIAT